VFGFDDLGNYHLPLRHLYQQALRAGDSLLWTPSLFAGYYLHGEGQIGMLHPWHLLLYGTLPLQVAFNLEFAASYPFAFAGMFWLLRRLGLTSTAALLGGMLFAFSGFLVMHHPHVNLVAVTAHLPWLLGSIDLVIAADRPRDRARGFAAVALVLASALLLGFPQAIWWTFLTAAPFVLLRAAQAGRWGRLVPAALAAATGLLLGGIQLLPTLDMAAESSRSLVARSFAVEISLHPWNILQLWAPYVFVDRVFSSGEALHVHEYAIYSGTLVMIAPLWLWLRRHERSAHRTLIVATAAFAAVMFVLALGQYGYLAFLFSHVPGVRWFRAPARYIFLVQFALAILAAVAVDDLLALARPGSTSVAPALKPRRVALLCSIAALSILTTALLNAHWLTVPAKLPIGPAFTAALWTAPVVAVTIAFLLAARGIRWGLVALIALSAADLGASGLEYVYRQPPQTIDSLSQGLSPGAPGTHGRVVANWLNRPVLKEYRLIGGYVGLYPNIPFDSLEFRQRAGAQWAIGDHGRLTPLSWVASPRADLLLGDASGEKDEGSTRMIEDRPGRLVVATSGPVRALLATTERFHEGWRATVDGTPTRTRSVDGFIGCMVGAGQHQVEFRFMPRSFVRGAMMSAAGAVFLALGVLVTLRRERPATS
jgi:hypothetical protein